MDLRRDGLGPADHPDRGRDPPRGAGAARAVRGAARDRGRAVPHDHRDRRSLDSPPRRGRVAAGPGRAPDRARRPPRPRLRPAGALRRARLGPPVHRPGLPARDARGRRDPAGRLRARPVARLLPRLVRVARDRGGRCGVRPDRRRRLDLLAHRRRSVPAPPLRASLPRRPASRVRRRDRLRAGPPRVGLRPLEEPRRVRAPGRRRRRLARIPRQRPALGRDRHRLPLGDAVQHLALQPPSVPRRPGVGAGDAGGRGPHRRLGDAVGEPRVGGRAEATRPGIGAPAPRARAQLRGGRARGPLRP